MQFNKLIHKHYVIQNTYHMNIFIPPRFLPPNIMPIEVANATDFFKLSK